MRQAIEKFGKREIKTATLAKTPNGTFYHIRCHLSSFLQHVRGKIRKFYSPCFRRYYGDLKKKRSIYFQLEKIWDDICKICEMHAYFKSC